MHKSNSKSFNNCKLQAKKWIQKGLNICDKIKKEI